MVTRLSISAMSSEIPSLLYWKPLEPTIDMGAAMVVYQYNAGFIHSSARTASASQHTSSQAHILLFRSKHASLSFSLAACTVLLQPVVHYRFTSLSSAVRSQRIPVRPPDNSPVSTTCRNTLHSGRLIRTAEYDGDVRRAAKTKGLGAAESGRIEICVRFCDETR